MLGNSLLLKRNKNAERHQKQRERLNEAEDIVERGSSARCVQGTKVMACVSTLEREPLPVQASPPRRESPWILVQFLRTLRTARVTVKRREAWV